MNRIILIGRLTQDPQGGMTNSGKQYARFSLAVSRMGDGADFFDIVAWDKQAVNSLKYLQKGSQVAIAGHVQIGSYDHNGVKRKTFDVVADQVEFIGSKQNSDDGQRKDASIDDLQPVDDDMPF